jgi:hypothetical protein
MSFFLLIIVKFGIPTIHKVRNIRFFVGKVFSESQNWTKKCPKIEKGDSGLQKHAVTA